MRIKRGMGVTCSKQAGYEKHTIVGEISDSHGGEYEVGCFLRYCTV